MPLLEEACRHCPSPAQEEEGAASACCGVCAFEGGRCSELYPGQGRSEVVAEHLLDLGFSLQVRGTDWGYQVDAIQRWWGRGIQWKRGPALWVNGTCGLLLLDTLPACSSFDRVRDAEHWPDTLQPPACP